MTYLGDERTVLVHSAIGVIEWSCWRCGGAGAGFMPEPHASGACEVTKTVPRMVLNSDIYADGGGI